MGLCGSLCDVFEMQTAIAVAGTPFLSYLPSMWAATAQSHRDDFDQQQMWNATCVCGGAAALLSGTASFNAATYASTNCSGEGRSICICIYFGTEYRHTGNHSLPGTEGIHLRLSAAMAAIYSLTSRVAGITAVSLRTYDAQGNATITTPINQTDVCAQAIANLTTHYTNLNSTLMSLLVNQRLGNMK